jgi:hypothetical protein
MRIDSGSSNSIQMLKAQQAWEARRAAKNNAAPAQTDITETAQPDIAPRPQRVRPSESIPAAPANTASTQVGLSPQWQRTVREVQNIASQAGFVGVSEQDIRRAYTHGESLLADYRV